MQMINKEYLYQPPIKETDILWRDVHDEMFDIYGIYNAETSEKFYRIPSEISVKVSKDVHELNDNTAGGRIRFQTDSPYIAIRVEMPEPILRPHVPQISTAGFDLYCLDSDDMRHMGTFMYISPEEDNYVYESIIYTRKTGICDFVINMPNSSGFEKLEIGLKADATLMHGKPYRNKKPVVFYGSSITQGGCASRPGNAYQNFLSRKFNMDYTNLGFSGSCKGEKVMVDYLATLEMSVFVSDFDHNEDDIQKLEVAHMNLYKTVRSAHPDIPYLIMTRPDTDLEYNWCEARAAVLHKTYEYALENGDKNVYFIYGEELFEGDERSSCTVDGIHPNDLGFYRMSQRVAKEFEKFIEKII